VLAEWRQLGRLGETHDHIPIIYTRPTDLTVGSAERVQIFDHAIEKERRVLDVVRLIISSESALIVDRVARGHRHGDDGVLRGRGRTISA
jgi:hypothetical protein